MRLKRAGEWLPLCADRSHEVAEPEDPRIEIGLDLVPGQMIAVEYQFGSRCSDHQDGSGKRCGDHPRVAQKGSQAARGRGGKADEPNPDEEKRSRDQPGSVLRSEEESRKPNENGPSPARRPVRAVCVSGCRAKRYGGSAYQRGDAQLATCPNPLPSTRGDVILFRRKHSAHQKLRER